MKRFPNIIILIFLFISQLAYGQWVQQNSGSTEHLRGVHFFDSDVGIAAGFNGTILKSIDGGVSWNEVFYESENVFWDVHFVNKSIGWIIGANGTLLHTEDQGETWVQQDIETSEYIWGISFLNENEGWVVGNSGKAFYTEDRGETWVQKTIINSLSTISDVHFLSDSEGFAVTQKGVSKTTDGGDTWEFQSVSFYTLGRIFFVDHLHGWVSGEQGRIYNTKDGGESWERQFPPTLEWIQDVYFLNENDGWAVGRNGKIFTTSNGGDDWEAVVSPTLDHLMKIQFNGPDEGWAVGSNGTILKYDIMSSIWELGKSEKSEIAVYPNPIVDVAIIELPNSSRNVELELVHMNGSKIVGHHFAKIADDTFHFARKNLSSGAYVLNVVGHDAVETKVLILK